MSKPFVSIIIPYYKSRDSILRALGSIINQTDSDWELLVVDDGSQDGLNEVVGGLNCTKIKFFQKDNSGPSDTRNFGADRSAGKFLAFLDSDDWLDSSWLERFKIKYREEPYEIAYCFGALVDEVTKAQVDWRTFPKFRIRGHLQAFNNLVGTFIVSRELFMLSGRFDPALRYSENMDLALRILNSKVTVSKSYIPEVLAYFGNTTDPKSRNKKYGRALLLKDLGYFQNKNLKILKENQTFLRSIIRRQLVSATVCLDWPAYIKKLLDLFRCSLKDGLIYAVLFFILPINYFRLKFLGFRK